MRSDLSHSRAHALVNGAANRSVLVVGDVMLDHFLLGRVNRISPEAPVPVVEFMRDEYRLGGAANVAQNIRALGSTVILAGAVGEDEAAEQVRATLERDGSIAQALVVDSKRPTTRKVRVITDRRQQVARVDYESDQPLDEAVEDALLRAVSDSLASVDVVVVSDYLKGTVTARLMETLIAWSAQRGTQILVDPKIPHLPLYRGAHLVTPNHHEAEAATHRRIRTDEEAREAARAFREHAGCESVLITRGAQGMWLLDGPALDRATHASRPGPRRIEESGGTSGVAEAALPAVAREVADVTGAGDTVVATMALALAAGGSLFEAAVLANRAAGLAVAKFGPATVSPAELLATWDSQSR